MCSQGMSPNTATSTRGNLHHMPGAQGTPAALPGEAEPELLGSPRH